MRYAAPISSATADTSPILPPIFPRIRFKTGVVVPDSLKSLKGVVVETISTGDSHGLIAVGKTSTRNSLPNSAGLNRFLGNPPKTCFPIIMPTAEAMPKT